MSLKETEIGMIPENWDVKKISDIGEVIGGGTPKTKVEEYWNGDISWITPKDLSGFSERYIYKGERSITKEGLNNSSAKLLPKGTVLFSSRAPIGYLAIAGKELATNQGFKSIVCDSKKVNNLFIYYLLKNKKEEIEQIAGGSTFKEVSGKVVKEFKVQIPPLEEQKAIANILSTLDEKIEVNNKINKTLEKMAQTIFKHWFVDFEFPNENGEPYKSSGGEMTHSELGMIPKGWKVRTIKEIALNGNVICGKTPSTKKKENYGRYMPFITIPDMHNKVFVTVTERYLSKLGVESQNNKTLPPNSICVSCIATPGLVTLTTEKSQTNQQINSFQCKEGISYYYMYLNLSNRSEEIRTLGAGGSTTLNLNKTQFSKIKVIIPPKDIMFKFHNKVAPMFELIKQKDFENITLSKIRDSILPKLMSGEIRVPLDN